MTSATRGEQRQRQDHFFGGHTTVKVKVGLDPETFEFNLKPVPLLWLYEPRFVRFLQRFVWDASVRGAFGGTRMIPRKPAYDLA